MRKRRREAKIAHGMRRHTHGRMGPTINWTRVQSFASFKPPNGGCGGRGQRAAVDPRNPPISERDMDKTCKASDLFVKLSPPVACALAVRLSRGHPPASQLDGKSLLVFVWHQLGEEARASLKPAILRMLELSVRRARSHVLEHARLSRADLAPAAARILDAVSTADLAVRLYLDDEEAFERAYLQHLTVMFEQVSIYHGKYAADVIPSHDRRARMLRAMHAFDGPAGDEEPLDVAEVVSDDRFLLALHHAADVKRPRRFDATREFAPDLSQPQIEVAVLFRFDLSMLAVKARTFAQRESLREAFTKIFVGDAQYFEPRAPQKPRYRLTIAGPAATRPKPRSERETVRTPYAPRS